MDHHFRDSLNYLYSLQFFGIKLGLDNTRELLSRVGNPQEQLKIIHIAGTNGKGSTAAAIASIFQSAGISAGLFTSPHLHNFTERIRVDTLQISESEVVELIDELRPYAEELRATFFEFTTAMALLCFHRRGVQWAVLETGLGGRLDATNVVIPELCLVTPISFDHTSCLGNELSAIASEKAGIFKLGVPVISAYQPEEVSSVLEQHATELKVPLSQFGHDYHCQSEDDSFSLTGPGFLLEKLNPALVGRHQHCNLALAAAAALFLAECGVEIGLPQIRQGLEKVCWPGRLEWLPERILLDGAHNPAGAKKLATYLQQQNLKDVHLVVGCKADKQANELLSELLPFAEHVYATCPPVDAAVPVEELVDFVHGWGGRASGYANSVVAVQAALEGRSPGETVLVVGSLFLVAEIREHLLKNVDTLAITIDP